MTQEYVHPAFPQPVDNSIPLWGYMNLFKFKWLMEEKGLYMPSADQLGDPFEGTTPTGHWRWWQQLEDGAETEEQKEIYRNNRLKLGAFAKRFRNLYYVSCWHMNQHENVAMWRCYTNTVASVAIRTTYNELEGSLPSFVNIGLMRYID